MGFFDVVHEDILELSSENEAVLSEYFCKISKLEATGHHYLGPFLCHKDDSAGYSLYATTDLEVGTFIPYLGKLKTEGDRYDERLKSGEIVAGEDENNKDGAPDDLYTLVRHASLNENWDILIDPSKESNHGRFAGGVNTKNLDHANCLPMTVKVHGMYYVILLVIKKIRAGQALQYNYGGLNDEKKYKKILDVTPELHLQQGCSCFTV